MTTSKWVEHTAKCLFTVTWLILLLRTDVNVPPNRVSDLDVLVKNISYFSTLTWFHVTTTTTLRIYLNIDGFERVIESYVLESNIANTSVIISSRNRAYGHSDSINDLKISNHHIFCALGKFSSIVHRLDCNCIVKVGNLYSFDQNVLA